ncbi:MAG: hypothetical protein RJS98_04920, partial [Rhodospirillaceae bacterium]
VKETENRFTPRKSPIVGLRDRTVVAPMSKNPVTGSLMAIKSHGMPLVRVMAKVMVSIREKATALINKSVTASAAENPQLSQSYVGLQLNQYLA